MAVFHFATQPVFVFTPDSFTYKVVPAPPERFKYKAGGLAVTAPRPVATAFAVAVAVHELVRAALVSRGSRARRRS